MSGAKQWTARDSFLSFAAFARQQPKARTPVDMQSQIYDTLAEKGQVQHLLSWVILALAEHLEESAPAWRPIGSATETVEPKVSQPDKPELPRGDDLEEVWHIADKLCLIFDAPFGQVFRHHRQQIYVDAARHLIAELDRYRSAPQ